MGDWGWRIPFFIGCAIVPFLFYIRRSLEETEEFLAQKHRPTTREVFRSLGRELRHRVARHDDGRDDDRLVLHDHRLYPDVRQDGAEAVARRTA